MAPGYSNNLKKAIRYIIEGKSKAALKIFLELDESESPLEIFKGRGICYEMANNNQLARQNFKKGLGESRKINNEKSALWFWRKRVELISVELCQKDKTSRAIRLLKEAVRKDPLGAELFRLLANIYWEKQEYDLAIELLSKLVGLEIGPEEKSSALFRIGFIREKKKEFQEAEKAYIEAIKLSPNNYGAYIRLGSIYSERGEKERAYQEWQKAERLNPKNPDLLFVLIYLSKDEEKSREYLRKLLEVDPYQIKEILEAAPVKETYKIILEEILRSHKERDIETSLLQALEEGQVNRDWLEDLLIETERREKAAARRRIRKKKKITGKERWVLELIGKALMVIEEANNKRKKSERVKSKHPKIEEDIVEEISKTPRRKKFDDEYR